MATSPISLIIAQFYKYCEKTYKKIKPARESEKVNHLAPFQFKCYFRLAFFYVYYGEKHESNHKIRHGGDALIDSARSLRLSLA